MRMVRGGWLPLIALLIFGCAAGSELLPLDGQLSLQTGETRSTLERDTGRVTTSAVLRVDNQSDRPLLVPLHVVLRPADGGAMDRARLEFGAGAFSQSGQLGLTTLSGNSLPLPLPRGWTPLAAIHYSFPGELVDPGVVTWLPALSALLLAKAIVALVLSRNQRKEA